MSRSMVLNDFGSSMANDDDESDGLGITANLEEDFKDQDADMAAAFAPMDYSQPVDNSSNKKKCNRCQQANNADDDDDVDEWVRAINEDD